MPSLRPVTEEGGEAKINITPQLVKEIFEEYPRVKTAFEENVPDKISEEVFWKRYVHSRFNDRNRGTTSVVNDDIFDKCWTETEDDLNQEREHGRKRLKISNLRDLSATKEDHFEIDFAPDITMRAGQGKIISLLRRNNRHGERILESACEKSRKYKEMTAQKEKKELYTEDILMDDLIVEEISSTFKLDITDQREYFASQTTEIDNDAEMIDTEQGLIKHQSSTELLSKFRESFINWNPNLKKKSLFPKNQNQKIPVPNLVTKVCNEMIEDKQNRLRESKPKIENLPPRIEKEINTIQLMGNEFLRHFWASVDSTVKEKAEKNKRMIEQLKSILIKIDQISELQPSDDDNNKQGPNGVQKSQKLDKEQRAIAVVNGKRSKIVSRVGGSSSEQVGGYSNGSSRIESEWKDGLIQAQQMLSPLSKAINKALSHNVSRPNNRQGPPISQNLQKSAVRASSPDHHRAVPRDSKTSSPDHHKFVSRDTKPTSPDIQKPILRNREAKQITNQKIQKSNNHNTQHDTQQVSISEVQRPSNRQINTNMRQDTNRVNNKVSVRNSTQVQTARSEANREAVPNRTKLNGRDIHHATPKSSNVAPPGSSTQVSSVNRIKSSTKRKR